MSGSRRRDWTGQLALLDAIVFFTIAMVIMLILSSYSGEYLVSAAHHDTTSVAGQDPGEILRVVLSASISKTVSIPVVDEGQLRPSVTVAECLATELELLEMGIDPGAFGELNAVLRDVVYSLLVPGLEACLLAYGTCADSSVLLLSIGELPEGSERRDSSHALLPSSDSSGFLVCLVLSPSALPELLQVG